MIPFEVTILGSNSAIPAHDRNPSGQWVQMDNYHFLMDCGEGTQMRVLNLHLKLFKLDAIFISHMHGDHIFGLPGLLTTMALQGRTKDLKVYGPQGLKRWLSTTFEISGGRFEYELEIIEINASSLELVLENDCLKVITFPLSHRIQTNGYLFQLKSSSRKLNGELAEKLNIPYEARTILKDGQNYTQEDGTVLISDEWTSLGSPQRTYAYCSDTIYDTNLIEFVQNADLLYHESTYTHDMEEQAAERYHSTAKQAALIAKAANVKKLLLGHASSRYKDVAVLEIEATEVFENCVFAREGDVFTVK